MIAALSCCISQPLQALMQNAGCSTHAYRLTVLNPKQQAVSSLHRLVILMVDQWQLLQPPLTCVPFP
jgi:hypothetical protein